MLFAPAGPNPGSVTTNFRMFVGLCANGNALRERARTAPAAVPRDSSCRLVIVMWVPLTCANETLVTRRAYVPAYRAPGPTCPESSDIQTTLRKWGLLRIRRLCGGFGKTPKG